MDKAEQPTITQADRQLWKFIIDASKLQCACIDREAPTAPELQAIAKHRIAGQSASCDLGVGCDEAGVCYAMANGKPEMCPRTTSLAAQDGLVEALEHIVEYWNRDQNEDAMSDALWHIIETASDALSAIKEQHHG